MGQKEKNIFECQTPPLHPRSNCITPFTSPLLQSPNSFPNYIASNKINYNEVSSDEEYSKISPHSVHPKSPQYHHHVIHEAELAEVKLKYQEVKHRLKESFK